MVILEWYTLLHKYFLDSRDELLIVCDKRQNIFNRELDWLDKRVTREGLDKFKEGYIDLTVSYRLPARITIMVNEFSEIFGLNQELKIAKGDDNPVLIHSHHIVWLNIKEEDWWLYVYNAFLRLKREKNSVSDIVILLPSHNIGINAVKFFKEQNIETNHIFEETIGNRKSFNKRSFWMGDGRLKMSTIHSFKGWEISNVVLFIPYQTPESIEKLDSIVYTAITRTRKNLIVLNANKRYEDFGGKLPKKWHEQ